MKSIFSAVNFTLSLCVPGALVLSLTLPYANALDLIQDVELTPSTTKLEISRGQILLPVPGHDIKQHLDQFIANNDGAQLSVAVWDLANKQSLYEHNTQAMMQPASVMKLLTAVSAIDQLGADFRFTTRLFTSQPIQEKAHYAVHQGQFKGDIYLQMTGDPSLLERDLSQLIAHLSDSGITHILGNVYLFTQEDEQIRAPGWVWDDLGICYAAPVSQFTVDKNCIKAQLSLDTVTEHLLTGNGSQHTKLVLTPDSAISITNSAVFMTPKASEQDKKFCQLSLARFDHNDYHLSGCYPSDKPLTLAIAINDPKQNIKSVLKRLFVNAGITLHYDIQEMLTPTHKSKAYQEWMHSLVPLADHSSAPLTVLINTMIKESDNLIADSLFKAVANDFYGQASDFSRASQAQANILSTLGIDLRSANLADGSGLSRYNLLSAAQLMSLLQLIYTDTRFSSLDSALPQAGVSGTLAYKTGFNHPSLKAKIFAKTGTMLGVANLAGRLKTDKGQTYLFVVLRNGISPHQQGKQAVSLNLLLELMALLEQ